MKILAFETSCDETAVAILDTVDTRRPYRRRTFIEPKFRILSNIVSSQVKIHKPFGGVVPNLAQREHQRNLVPVLLQTLREEKMLVKNDKRLVTSKKTNIDQQKLATHHSSLITILEREPELLALFQKHILPLQSPPIDAIAVTYGPGLEPALWVGINFAKALSALWNKPLIPVNHLEGHIYASWLPKTLEISKSEFLISKQTRNFKKQTSRSSLATSHYPEFPILALIVSGGHAELVLMKKHLDYKILGETRDDAAGEAFDKVAKMLGLGYPGGPEISRLAEKGNPHSIKFPRPMIGSNNFDFSFSGLKTAVLYYLREDQLLFESASEPAKRGVDMVSRTRNIIKKYAFERVKTREKQLVLSAKANIAASFEQAVVDVLVAKTSKALRQYGAPALKRYGIRSLIVGGGVAANNKLRASLEELITNHYPHVTLHLSPLWLCGDNAAMIAAAAYFRSLQKQKFDVSKIRANGNLKLS